MDEQNSRATLKDANWTSVLRRLALLEQKVSVLEEFVCKCSETKKGKDSTQS